MRTFLLALIALLGAQAVASAQSLPVPSLWQNQRGSTLQVTAINGPNFRGTFINRAPGTGCRNTPYPVTGASHGPQITFTVNFTRCRTVTTWRGSAIDPGMSVQWVLQYAGQPPQVGFDFFGRRR